MAKEKFTPGPWYLDTEDLENQTIAAVKTPKDGGDIICEMPAAYEFSMKRWPANARLIAAAPEMYEVLEMVYREFYDTDNNTWFEINVLKQVQQTLAKARGESINQPTTAQP